MALELGGIRPSLDEVVGAAQEGYRRVPVKRELMADGITTIEAFRALRAASSHCFMLESAEAEEHWGRYSFLGYAPTVEITCANGHLRVTRDVEGERPLVEEREVEHPNEAVRAILDQSRAPKLEGFPPFCGGLVGYFAYDYLKYAEPTLRREGLAHEDFLDMDLMLFDRVVCFDSYRQRLVLVTLVDTSDADPASVSGAYEAAAATLDEMQRTLSAGARHDFEPLRLSGDLELAYSKERYCQMVRTAQDHIREGDIFQVVLSNPMSATATGSLFDAYRVLRATNPSPYMVFFSSEDVEIAAASPETLARLEDGRLFTYPLAGTRPRGATPEEDEALAAGLLADEKELAEHNMLVDLGRNDIGRVAALGSVRVDTYHDVLRFSHVMHIGSTVSGRLAEGRDGLDVIDSILPAGTLSGAPKIRACQIISDLEGQKRGIYGGAIGYLDLTGNVDTCIGIRLAYKKHGQVFVQSGAGIVADSVPESEYQECRNKARAVVEAVRQSEGGLA